MRRALSPMVAVAVLLCGAAASFAAHHEEKEEKDVAVAKIDEFIAKQDIDKSSKAWKTRLPKPPLVEFEDGKSYYWDLETNVGTLTVELLPDVAPMHVSSTIYLTRIGFYDGVGFHRVITGFMAQGGDPLGNGRGGPGYKYDGEFDPKARHDKRGTLSMANAGPGTDGSQFFLTFKATPFLDDRHTVFGYVSDGEDTLAELEKRGRPRDPAPPTEPLEIVKATIRVE